MGIKSTLGCQVFSVSVLKRKLSSVLLDAMDVGKRGGSTAFNERSAETEAGGRPLKSPATRTTKSEERQPHPWAKAWISVTSE